jgi:HEAT repeats
MPRGHKRWIIAGLAVVLATSAAVVVLRTTKPGRDRANADRAATAINYGAGGPGLAGESPAVVPETPETIAAEVDKSLGSWRDAILARRVETVLALDAAFTASPARYLPALRTSATGDADERVRAFSTRVLGKLKDPTLAGVFEELLADKSPFVRQNAAWALGELAAVDDGRAAARRAVAELRQARSRDPAPDVRSAAKSALAKME